MPDQVRHDELGVPNMAQGNMLRLWMLFAALLGFAAPARAQDDVSAAGRSVVRVAVGAARGDEVVVLGHGTGFAVGGNRIVTNAHVVAVVISDPENIRVGVVPSEGSAPSPARIIAVDPARDLALLEMQQGALPIASLYTGQPQPGMTVAALGYPGNVDYATARSIEDFLQPRPPSRSMGNFSDARQTELGLTLVHTADIARGHSGGPLVDPCGRVVGVNVAITNNEMGDSSFGFAIPASLLVEFLREQGQPFAAVATPCISSEQRERSEAERAERERREREADEAERAREADLRRAEALAAISDARETHVGIAVLLLVLSLAAMGATGVLVVKNRNRPAIYTGVAAGVLLIAAATMFFTRPSLDAARSDPEEQTEEEESRFVGENLCRLEPDRSRVTVSDTRDVRLSWDPDGCVNESTQYARDGEVWRRVLVPNQEQAVSVTEFNPASGEYVVSRYLLSAAQMEEARRLRRRVEQKACTSDAEARLRMTDQQRDLVKALPARPNERLIYSCTPSGD